MWQPWCFFANFWSLGNSRWGLIDSRSFVRPFVRRHSIENRTSDFDDVILTQINCCDPLLGIGWPRPLIFGSCFNFVWLDWKFELWLIWWCWIHFWCCFTQKSYRDPFGHRMTTPIDFLCHFSLLSVFFIFHTFSQFSNFYFGLRACYFFTFFPIFTLAAAEKPQHSAEFIYEAFLTPKICCDPQGAFSVQKLAIFAQKIRVLTFFESTHQNCLKFGQKLGTVAIHYMWWHYMFLAVFSHFISKQLMFSC